MRRFALILLACAVFSPAHGRSQALDPAKLVGRWSGRGTLFDAALQRKVGALSFVADFADVRSGTGKVGQATFQNVRIRATREHIEVTADLTGRIGADPALAKDHLVLLVTMLDDRTMAVEFHLKSNTIYDPWMREGRVIFTRAP